VTGGNDVWIVKHDTPPLPAKFLAPTITRAKELIEARDGLRDTSRLRRVVNLPSDLSGLSTADRAAVDQFVVWAEKCGADRSYIARHRAAWWSVGMYPPAPILCTYMARRPPVFVRNYCGARHINIAHGLYPKVAVSDSTLDEVTRWLNVNVTRRSGRTYAGGLTKFEPREIERLPLPSFDELD
jgi:adenine-specific DNA-methyltransferase